jgi:DNA-binding SARP family transcriptional activator/tetratricopeptide (TPR) repeat protein
VNGRLDFRVLGPLEVVGDQGAVALAQGKARVALGVLLIHANEVVATDRLIDDIWGARPPATATKSVHVYVSQLRRSLGADAIVTRPPGYELRLEPGQLDLYRFERLRKEAAHAEPATAAATLREALALWRGPPFADFTYAAFAQATIARLEELRLGVLEDRIAAELELGQHGELVGELATLAREHPLRERIRAAQMLALYRSGRQADALAAYQSARRALVDELGIEPGRSLRELEQAVLRQDPGLDPVPEVEAAVVVAKGGGAMSPLVGRERELAELMAGFEEAVSGRGRLFLVSGEPGIGKSRLVDELTSWARRRGAAVLVGRCWEAGGAPPFWPWVQALRAHIRDRDSEPLRAELGGGAPDLAQLVPGLRERFPEQPEPLISLESEAARFQLFDGVASFLRSTAQGEPLVVVLDDLHAADEPSLLLLRFVTRALADSRVLVVGAYRSVDPTPAGPLAAALAELAREPATRTITLAGFTQDEVARLIELTTAGPVAAGLAETVRAKTEGNPLFVGEIVRLLAAEGRLDESVPRLGIPHGLREVIARRRRQLSGECNRVLSLASVLGHEFDLDLLANVSGLEASSLLDLLDEAIVQQLVGEVPGRLGRLRFAHALFRDGLYEELPPSRRRQLHREVGEALEKLSSGDAEQHLAALAYHFCEAVPSTDPGKAVDYARRAGDHAVGVLAPEEADRLYELALSVADDHQRPRLLLRTARSMWMAGIARAERAVEARDALIVAGDGEGVVEAELLLANIHYHEGRRPLVSEHMQRALALVRDRPLTRLTAEVLDNASRFHMLADEEEEAISLGGEGLAIAEQLGLESVRAHCLTTVGVARSSLGDPGGLEDLKRAVEIAVAAQDGWAEWRARANLADCLLWRFGDTDRAFDERHELRGLLQTAGSWAVARWNQSYDAWESYWRGRWTETLAICSEFIEQVEAGNPHYAASELYSLRALVGVSRSAETALDDARVAVILGRRAQDARNLYPAIAVNAHVAAELGRFDEADRLLDELLLPRVLRFPLSLSALSPGYVVPLALAALVRGRTEDVLARLERLGPSPWRDAAAAVLHGDNVEAAELLGRIGVLPEEAHARLLAAEAFAVAGDQEAMQAQLERCLPLFDGVGATAYLRRGRGLLPSSPEKA